MLRGRLRFFDGLSRPLQVMAEATEAKQYTAEEQLGLGDVEDSLQAMIQVRCGSRAV